MSMTRSILYWTTSVFSSTVTDLVLKNAVFWVVALCTACVNRHFGGTYRLHLQGRKIRERGTSVSRWLQIVDQ
jgi:hypothetical protein